MRKNANKKFVSFYDLSCDTIVKRQMKVPNYTLRRRIKKMREENLRSNAGSEEDNSSQFCEHFECSFNNVSVQENRDLSNFGQKEFSSNLKEKTSFPSISVLESNEWSKIMANMEALDCPPMFDIDFLLNHNTI